jgi:hypothetical protein
MDDRLPDHATSDRSALRRRLRRALVAVTASTALLTAPGLALADDPSAQPPEQPQIEQPVVDQSPAVEQSEPAQTPPAADSGPLLPAEEAPVPQPVGETPPVEIPPVEEPPVENPPVENPPVENPPVENPPVETPPVETPPVEQPPVETPPVEQPTPVEPAPVELAPVDPAPVEEPVVVEEPPAAGDVDKPARESRPAPAETNATVTLPKPATGSGTLRPAVTDAPVAAAPVAATPAPATQTLATPPALEPVAVAPVLPAAREGDGRAAAADDVAAREAAAERIVRKTLVNLGIVPATPAATTSQVTPATVDNLFCAPVVVASAAPTPDGATTRLQVAKSVRKQQVDEQPGNVRGPPVSPFDAPSSPVTAGAAAAAGSGTAAGISFFAILVGSVSAQLAQAEAVAPPCSFASNSATPTSDDSARAPPLA